MYDGGGVGYATFAQIKGIETQSSQIILKLGDVYKRQKVNLYPDKEDVFTYDYKEDFHISGGASSSTCDRIYKITKNEYNAIARMYKKFTQIREQMKDISRVVYFAQKRK